MDEEKTSPLKMATRAIHAGSEPDPQTGAVMPPIYMTSTFALEEPGVTKGYDYTRGNNPNFEILERTLSALEGGKYAKVFSSGLGALTSYVATLKPGDKVIGIDGLYGGTWRLFNKVFSRFNIEFETIDIERLEDKLKTSPSLLLFETPTNPLLNIFDIEWICKKAKQSGVTTLIDNTFATPYLQNPLEVGADLIWHSTTKYIGGHSDVIGGAMITNDEAMDQALFFHRLALGTNPSPFDTWLLTRGVKTLACRMEQHTKNGLALATALSKHPRVKQVFYPGLSTHSGHEIAKKQMRGFGGIVSCEFDFGLAETKTFISSLKLFTLAESLGGVESLVNHPATMTHASIPREERLKLGISDGLVRFSCGLEHSDDLIADIDFKV